jgi:phosphoglycolate phosphatase
MAGRTERAIITETLTMAGVPDATSQVDAFIAELTARAPGLREVFAARGRALPGAAAALTALAGAAAAPAVPAGSGGVGGAAAEESPTLVVQSVLTGNVRAIAEAKLDAVGLSGYLDLTVGAYGEYHEVRAELVHLARGQAAAAYGREFAGAATVLVGDTPLDVAAALATGARAVGVATGPAGVAELAAAGAHAVLPDLTDTGAVVAAVLGTPDQDHHRRGWRTCVPPTVHP